jgi:hypothetical protein
LKIEPFLFCYVAKEKALRDRVIKTCPNESCERYLAYGQGMKFCPDCGTAIEKMVVGKIEMSYWDLPIGEDNERLYFLSSYDDDDKRVYVLGANVAYEKQFRYNDERFINFDEVDTASAKLAFQKAFAPEISALLEFADRCEVKFCATDLSIDYS